MRPNSSKSSFNLAEKQLQIGKFQVAGGTVNFRVEETGRINIAQIARKDPEKKLSETLPLESLESSATAVPPAPP